MGKREGWDLPPPHFSSEGNAKMLGSIPSSMSQDGIYGDKRNTDAPPFQWDLSLPIRIRVCEVCTESMIYTNHMESLLSFKVPLFHSKKEPCISLQQNVKPEMVFALKGVNRSGSVHSLSSGVQSWMRQFLASHKVEHLHSYCASPGSAVEKES